MSDKTRKILIIVIVILASAIIGLGGVYLYYRLSISRGSLGYNSYSSQDVDSQPDESNSDTASKENDNEDKEPQSNEYIEKNQEGSKLPQKEEIDAETQKLIKEIAEAAGVSDDDIQVLKNFADFSDADSDYSRQADLLNNIIIEAMLYSGEIENGLQKMSIGISNESGQAFEGFIYLELKDSLGNRLESKVVPVEEMVSGQKSSKILWVDKDAKDYSYKVIGKFI